MKVTIEVDTNKQTMKTTLHIRDGETDEELGQRVAEEIAALKDTIG